MKNIYLFMSSIKCVKNEVWRHSSMGKSTCCVSMKTEFKFPAPTYKAGHDSTCL